MMSLKLLLKSKCWDCLCSGCFLSGSCWVQGILMFILVFISFFPLLSLFPHICTCYLSHSLFSFFFIICFLFPASFYLLVGISLTVKYSCLFPFHCIPILSSHLLLLLVYFCCHYVAIFSCLIPLRSWLWLYLWGFPLSLLSLIIRLSINLHLARPFFVTSLTWPQASLLCSDSSMLTSC